MLGIGKSGKKSTNAGQRGPENVPASVAAWGWAASAARFRGLLVILLLIVVGFESATIFVMYATSKTTIVAIDNEGTPKLLLPTVARIDPAIFAERFVGYFGNYSPQTIDQNMQLAKLMATPMMQKSFDEGVLKDLSSVVKRDRIAQTISILKTDVNGFGGSGFTADVVVTRYRTLNGATTDEKIKYTIEVSSGPVTKTNGWGFYVERIRESDAEK